MRRTLNNTRGFTLVELIVAMTIFVFVASYSVVAFAQIIRSQTFINSKRELQDESRFVLEKIVKEFRNGTIDYPQYYIGHWPGTTYSQYKALPPDHNHLPAITDGVFIPGARNLESQMVILSPDGRSQTKIQRNGGANTAEMQKLTSCLDGTGEVTWKPDPSYAGGIFLSLNPAGIKVTDLKFFISPLKDPNKVFEDDSVQYQPTVIIRLSTQTPDGKNTIDLETSITSGFYDEATWDTTIINTC